MSFVTQMQFANVSVQQRTHRKQLSLYLCERSVDGQEGAHHFLPLTDWTWRLQGLGLCAGLVGDQQPAVPLGPPFSMLAVLLLGQSS